MRLAERQPVFVDCDCGLKSIVFPTDSPWDFEAWCLHRGEFVHASTISHAYINPPPTYTAPDALDIEHFWDQEEPCSWCGGRHMGGPEKCDDIPF